MDGGASWTSSALSSWEYTLAESFEGRMEARCGRDGRQLANQKSCNPDGHGSKSRIRAPEDPEPTARKGSPLVLRAWLSTIPFCFRNRTGVPCFVPGN